MDYRLRSVLALAMAFSATLTVGCGGSPGSGGTESTGESNQAISVCEASGNHAEGCSAPIGTPAKPAPRTPVVPGFPYPNGTCPEGDTCTFTAATTSPALPSTCGEPVSFSEIVTATGDKVVDSYLIAYCSTANGGEAEVAAWVIANQGKDHPWQSSTQTDLPDAASDMIYLEYYLDNIGGGCSKGSCS